ncbi:MAG: magnesium transporter [Halobacteriovoraceae bacterium]|jgi:magnesium transporter|nr:magnesium transporter [Halobacteriovoraceae bacterium]MBT5095456.1 magnesium transporter [Halobacteriovoraceae bacterium]
MVFSELHDITIYYSRSQGIRIFNEDGLKIGNLNDFFVNYEEVYPLVLAIQYRRNNQLFYINWDDVLKFSYKRIVVKNDFFIGRSRTFPKIQGRKVVTSVLTKPVEQTLEYPALGKIVMDRQIVDTHGKKVVRVNDIQFMKSGPHLRVTHAAIGIRSMIRRLGFEKPVDLIFRSLNPKSSYLHGDVLINWKYVHAIPNRRIQSNLELNLSNDDIKDIHPADLADILEDLDNQGREIIFDQLDPKTAAEVLSEVEEDIVKVLIRDDTPEETARILEEMDSDDAADILNDLDDKIAKEIISKIKDGEFQEDLTELLEYDEDSAGGLMSTDVFEVSPGLKKAEVMKFITEKYEDLETIYDIYVTSPDEELLGTCSLHDLLTQSQDICIEEIMNTNDIKSLPPDTYWREVAHFMSKYNLINVPIVSEDNKLLGLVTVDDVLPWLLGE